MNEKKCEREKEREGGGSKRARRDREEMKLDMEVEGGDCMRKGERVRKREGEEGEKKRRLDSKKANGRNDGGRNERMC